ncbi:MAG: carbon storage regulator [Candidatus Thorarchaeota archaeon]|jgi:carbon storage regulator CsrA
MLVLSRKKDERISIHLPERETPIEITVVRVDNLNKVRLGIEAEKDVIVLRSELEK